MRVFDSPITTSTVHQSGKYKNHESPIQKLSTLSDLRSSYQQTRMDNVLNDRSNEIFIPKNASKYIEESFEKKYNREKEIQEIRKKYYEQGEQKNSRSVSQKYDRYEIYRGKDFKNESQQQNLKQIEDLTRKEIGLSTRPSEPITPNRQLDYTPIRNSYKPDQALSNNNSINSSSYTKQTRQSIKPDIARDYGKENLRPSLVPQERKSQMIGSHLERISQASNSNYQTVNKTAEVFSPEKNRVKSSFVVDDRSNKRMMNTSSFFCVESFKNKQNYKSIIKETTSINGESAQNSAGVNRSGSNPYYDKDSIKSNRYDPVVSKVESIVRPYDPKPFSVEEPLTVNDISRDAYKKTFNQTSQSQQSNGYSTIYDKYLPSTNQKPTKREQEFMQRPRTLTDFKKATSSQAKETGESLNFQEQKNQIKRRVFNYGDDDRMKEIEKRLKDKEIELRRKEESIKTRCESSFYDKRAELLKNRQENRTSAVSSKKTNDNYTPDKSSAFNQEKTPSARQNVDQEIQRLSSKIKQFENRKKQLNIQSKYIDNISTHKTPVKSQQPRTPQPSEFQNARRALQEYRQNSRSKSNLEVLQVDEYRIPSERNNRESTSCVRNREESELYKRQSVMMEKPKEIYKRCDFIQNTKPMYSQKTLSQTKNVPSSRFGLQLFKIQCEQSDDISSCRSKNTNISTGSTNVNQCRNKFQLYRKADEGIEQRKKKLKQNKKGNNSQQIKKLVSVLSQQSIHDEEFRNCKIWFHNQKEDSKWKELKQALKIHGDLRYTQLRDGTIAEFHICQDQNNPFFSVNQESKFTYQALVRSYADCKKYWSENVQKKFDRNVLKVEGLSLEKFDLEKKGFINLEDFVRFMNFESGNFYRNRDLILIFKRFMNQRSETQDKSLAIEKIFDMVSY